jgi:hypothetical protein
MCTDSGKKVEITRTTFTLMNTPSQPFLYQERIRAVANVCPSHTGPLLHSSPCLCISHHASLQCKADMAVLVISAESQEFAICMADCSSTSLFETALLLLHALTCLLKQ